MSQHYDNDRSRIPPHVVVGGLGASEPPSAHGWLRMRLLLATLSVAVASCVSVTRTSGLDTEPGRAWSRQSAGTKIVVESADGAETSGRLVDTRANVVRLQGSDLAPVAIPLDAGANLRERRRGTGALLGALAGTAVGVVLGVVLTDNLGTPNPDSAGGVEHPPLLLPLGALAGIVVGAVVGFAVGAERRLELRSVSPQ
jgi:hypothetical protein